MLQVQLLLLLPLLQLEAMASPAAGHSEGHQSDLLLLLLLLLFLQLLVTVQQLASGAAAAVTPTTLARSSPA